MPLKNSLTMLSFWNITHEQAHQNLKSPEEFHEGQQPK